MHEISAKQLYIMIFFIPLVFKMSSLPALFYEEAATTSYILIGIVTTVEFLQMGLVLYVCSKGGLEGIKEKYGKKTYCLVALPMLFIVFMKMLILTQEITTYICSFLFYNVAEKFITPLVLLVVFYLGIKGARAIGRLFELSIWFLPIIAVFGIFFGKIDMDATYLTPLFQENAGVYLSTPLKYLIFTFDFSPLLFFKIKFQRKSPVVLCSFLSILTVTAGFALLYCAYGNASAHANCAFARLATFNTIVSEIGGLDWPSTLLWLVTAVLSLSLKIGAVHRISDSFGTKHVGTFLFCFAIGITLLSAVKTISDALNVVTNGVQYGVFAAEILLPVVVILLLTLRKKEEVCAVN